MTTLALCYLTGWLGAIARLVQSGRRRTWRQDLRTAAKLAAWPLLVCAALIEIASNWLADREQDGRP